MNGIRNSASYADVMMAALLAFVAAGCGSDGGYTPPAGVVLKGRIVNQGKPLHVERPDIGLGSVDVILVPADADPEDPNVEMESTITETDGSFMFEGAGSGIAVGKYRLAVLHHEQGPDEDMLKGKFSEADSPIDVEIEEANLGGTQDLGDIELSKYADQPSSGDGPDALISE